jgi:hypothetical protein
MAGLCATSPPEESERPIGHPHPGWAVGAVAPPAVFYNYELSNFGVRAFTVSTMSGALVLTWLYNSTGGSVLVTTLWHGAFNTAVAGAQGAVAPLVSGLVVLAAVLIARGSGPELRHHARTGLATGTGARPRRHSQ